MEENKDKSTEENQDGISSPTAFQFSDVSEPLPPVGTYSYSEVLAATQDTNRRQLDALNYAARASAYGTDPVEIYQSTLADPNYDANNRSQRFLESLGAVAEEAQPAIQQDVASGQDTGAASSFKQSIDYIFQGIVPAYGVARLIESDKQRTIPDLKSTSKEAMLEARAYVESIPSSSSLSTQEKDDVAFLKYVENLTAKVADDIGWNKGTVSDFLGYMVPQENIRYEEVADILGIDYKPMDSIDYRDFLGRMSAYVRSEAPDKRQELVETLISAWPEIHGNNRIALVDTLNIISGKEDPYDDLRSLDNHLERVDQATLGFGTIGKIIGGGMKALNTIRSTTKLKNVEAVTDIVTQGSRGYLKDSNISPMDASSVLNPMESTNTLIKGTDNTYATEAGNLQKEVDIYLDSVERINNFGLGLKEEEMAAYRDRVVTDLEAKEGIYGVTVEPIDDVSFSVSYRTKGQSGSTVVTQPYELDAVGGFVSKGGEGHINIDLKATSPVFRFVSDRKELVQLPEQIQFQGNIVQSMYDEAIRAALKPNGKKLSRKEMKSLEHALIKGDEFKDDRGINVGKVFTRDELTKEGIEGVVLNDRAAEAYESVRKVMDHLHMAKNKEIIDLWNARGIKTINWFDTQAPVRVYEEATDAMTAFRTANTRTHWIGETDGSIKTLKDSSELTDSLLAQKYAAGYRLVRAAENKFLKANDTAVEWAFVRADDIKAPGGLVLNYRTGYIPRIKKDAFYFVKENAEVNIGGKNFPMTKTVRYFDSYIEASKFTDELNKLTPGKYKVLADRELSHSDLDREFINISGGLFTGKRSEGVPFGLEKGEGVRQDVLGSMQRYVRNLSRNVPMSMYRAGLQQRWLNHAKDVGALSKSYSGSFEDAIHANNLDIHGDSSAFLVDAHRQISFLTGVRTEDELQALARQRQIAKRLEVGTNGANFLSRRILNSSPDGLITTLRGVNFHLLLGLYNPAQFPIQASGAFVAMSIHPVQGLKAVGQMLAYGLLDATLGNPAQKAKALKLMRDKGFDVDGYEAWSKSGLRESIIKSNLDYNSLFTDMPYDAGLLNKILANSTFFHKSGELVSARVAFATAFNVWRETNKGAEVTNDALKAIIAKAETFRLNMTRANTAQFQKGILSLPTQFQQVNTKFFEKLLGKGELTSAQKTRLIAGQAALFGMAGIPLAKSLFPHFVDMYNQLVPEESRLDALNADPATLNAWQNGMLAWMIQDYMDIESVITGRMALGQDFIENLFGLFTEQVVLSDVVLGPASTLWQGIDSSLMRTITALTYVHTAEDNTPEDYAAVAGILGDSLLDIPATTRNMMKAYDMTHSQFFRDKKGRPVFEWEDLNTQTIIAQSLGFSSQEVADWYELNYRNLGAVPKSVHGKDSDRIVKFLVDMHSESDETNARRHAMAINAILSKYSKYQDRVDLIKEVDTKIKDPSNPWGKLMLNVINDWESDLQAGLSEIHAKMKTKVSPEVARQFAEKGMNSAVKSEASFEEGNIELSPVIENGEQRKTKEGRPVYQTPEGDYITERTITVTEEGINKGKPTNIPTVYNGRIVSDEEAISIIIETKGVDPITGKKLPSFSTIDEAVKYAESRTEGLGKQLEGKK